MKQMEKFSNMYDTVVQSKGKANSKAGPRSMTRSDYIGVSRNGNNWQSLITIKKRKMYITSYVSERQTALSFDFYSILANGIKAVTNFSYTKHIIIEMLKIYKENDNTFMVNMEDYPVLNEVLTQP